ncbi:MAG: diguanylate cyclase, partial [Gammaproteobacteria bacterium]
MAAIKTPDAQDAVSEKPGSQYRTSVAVACTGLLLALLLVIAALHLRAQQMGERHAGSTLSAAASTLGQLYVAARTEVVLSAERLAADRSVNKRRANPTEIAAQFNRRLDDASGFALLFDSDRNLIASAAGHKHQDAPALFANVSFTTTAVEGYQLVSLDDLIYGVALTATERPGRYVAYGVPLVSALRARWSGDTQLALTLSDVSLTSSGQQSAPFGLSFVLDEAGQDALVASLDLPENFVRGSYQSLVWVVLLAAAMALVIIGSLMTVALRATIARHWQKQLAPIAVAVQRAHDGQYNQRMQVPAGSLLAPLARQINDMFGQLEDRENRIAHHTQFDALTGLTNRSVVNERIDRAVEKARETGRSVAAVAIDVSRFNEINGTLG